MKWNSTKKLIATFALSVLLFALAFILSAQAEAPHTVEEIDSFPTALAWGGLTFLCVAFAQLRNIRRKKARLRAAKLRRLEDKTFETVMGTKRPAAA